MSTYKVAASTATLQDRIGQHTKAIVAGLGVLTMVLTQIVGVVGSHIPAGDLVAINATIAAITTISACLARDTELIPTPPAAPGAPTT